MKDVLVVKYSWKWPLNTKMCPSFVDVYSTFTCWNFNAFCLLLLICYKCPSIALVVFTGRDSCIEEYLTSPAVPLWDECSRSSNQLVSFKLSKWACFHWSEWCYADFHLLRICPSGRVGRMWVTIIKMETVKKHSPCEWTDYTTLTNTLTNTFYLSHIPVAGEKRCTQIRLWLTSE